MLTIGIVQYAPVHPDLAQSMARATSLIREAAGKGAGMVFFGEAWLTGYPSWLDFFPM